MAIDSDIRDQAYQFFIQEAPELLQLIEEELLTLTTERSTAKIHNMMRAAHSLKGGAASVGLETIKTLAHSLEDIFKGLHNEELEIDSEVEGLLLAAYDCLRLPLMEQITTGQFDADMAMATAEPVFAQIEEQIGEYLRGASELPSSIDLGVDIALSIFEVDVAQGLERLSSVLAQPQGKEIAGELRAQVEVFAGIAELLNLPGFAAIAGAALTALAAHPQQALQITQIAVADFEAGRQAVMAGDRTSGGSPSLALAELAGLAKASTEEFTFITPVEDVFGALGAFEDLSYGNNGEAPPESTILPCLDDLFGVFGSNSKPEDIPSITLPDPPALTLPETDRLSAFSELANDNIAQPEADTIPSLDDVFGTFGGSELTIPANDNIAQPEADLIPSLDEVFGIGSYSEPEGTDASTTLPERAMSLDIDVAPAIDENEILELTEIATTGADKVKTSPTDDVGVIPSLDDVFGSFHTSIEDATVDLGSAIPVNSFLAPTQKPDSNAINRNSQNSLLEISQSVEEIFNKLPPIEDLPTPSDQSTAIVPSASSLPTVPEKAAIVSAPTKLSTTPSKPEATATPQAPATGLSVRVDLERLERMNNLVGELAINRNSLALQNEHLQGIIQELLRKFAKFQQIGQTLRDFSDQLVVSPERYNPMIALLGSDQTGKQDIYNVKSGSPAQTASFGQTNFDSLEMDSYGELHSIVQTTLEEMVQLEETVVDVVLLAGHSSQTLERQRQMLGHLRDDLMWARMLPLSEVLNRFPRMLRDLSTSYQKPVALTLNGTGVLVDKAVLEKLNDPLVHLVRNAFDHGIETPDVRCQHGKAEQGKIEIRAYHQGSQTIIEVRDDGRGVNLERIRTKALEMGLLTPEQAATTDPSQLLELLFEPGFSTASQVSQLSGRGVGLDVVRAQLRSLKGSVTLTSEPGQGTIFTLRIPLTLTIAKLLVCFIGTNAFAFPSDSIAEILIPQPEQVKQSGGKRFLHWQGQIVPTYHLSQLLRYACPLPETQPSQALAAVPTPDDWASPM